MNDKLDEIQEGFQKAHEEAGDVSVETDVEAQQRERRERLLEGWDEDRGRELAAAEGLELDASRLRVVHCLREYYLEHDIPETGRALGDMLDETFAAEGGRKYLRRLFPGGPVTQGMKIAGLPVPGHTEDEGFGTAR